MVTNSHQIKRVFKIIVSSFLRQATVAMVQFTLWAATATFGVRRSALRALTTPGACTSIRAVAAWAAAAVSTVGLCVGFASNLSFQPTQYMKVLQAAPVATKHLHNILFIPIGEFAASHFSRCWLPHLNITSAMAAG